MFDDYVDVWRFFDCNNPGASDYSDLLVGRMSQVGC